MASEWASASLRQMVIQQIEDTYKMYGNLTSKSSQEVEKYILEKAQSRDDYLQMVARLILHIKEVRGGRGQPSGNQSVAIGHVVNGSMQNAQQLLQPQVANIRSTQMAKTNLSQALQRNLPAGSMQVTVKGGQIISQQRNLVTHSQQPTFTSQPTQQTMASMNNLNSATPAMPLTSSGQMLLGNPNQQQSNGAIQQKAIEQQKLIMKRLQMLQNQQQNSVNAPNTVQGFTVPTNKIQQQKVSIAQSSPVKSISAPSPQSQPQPSPSQPAPSPAYINPPSVGPLPSPLNPADEQAYIEKLKEMSKYIEPLSKLVSNIPIDEEHIKERGKLNGLLDMLRNKNRRVQLSVLNKCENVLRRLCPDAGSVNTTSTPDTTATIESLPTPVAKPTSTQPMREVVINVMSSAHFMSDTRQNIIPGMLALNAPMISPPSQLSKSRKRVHELSPVSKSKSPLPHALQMEIVHLLDKFIIKLDSTKPADKSGVTIMCKYRDKFTSSTYIISIRVPGDYPISEPEFILKDFGDAQIATEMKKNINTKLMRLPHAISFSSILAAWEQSIEELDLSTE